MNKHVQLLIDTCGGDCGGEWWWRFPSGMTFDDAECLHWTIFKTEKFTMYDFDLIQDVLGSEVEAFRQRCIFFLFAFVERYARTREQALPEFSKALEHVLY